MNKIIATYYQNVNGIDSKEELCLIDLWSKNWELNGFKTKVLSENDAKNNILYKKFCEKIETFKTINAVGYDRACFLRWLAMASQGEEMFMADYDCFVYKSFNPEIDPCKLNLFDRHVPCLIYGTKEMFEKMCLSIINYKIEDDDKNHFSDMLWLKKYLQNDAKDTLIHSNPIYVYQPDTIGWKTGTVVHYCNYTMEKFKPRSFHIPLLRDGLFNGKN